ncbi:1-acyl-sn-glycerol-3-phosphate acyltransferase [Runella rosea]|uniref:1-acyl-sn-glycerol-3-phosphate acyltransferase n=1 Tax=Runella rosea TaxID=2259595 RepID=A0A344TM09_9BACT|nr:lysophospholipid acyltransferase family protein [Runella rosea]AXE19680.1 1-acyl-sn-glycerol-3-phosphate acyltransferase [Runella rosea]
MKVIYTIWCFFWLILIFLLLFPFTYICLQRKEWKPYAHWINRLWGRLFFPLAGIRFEIEYRGQLAPKQAYVFCANHFSYLDIAVMGVIVEHYFAFVGKDGVKNIPLFGYMFRHLHIQVKRESTQSRVSSLNRAIKTLAQGRSIVVFPEGGIKAKQPPQMHQPFMDGAFKMAIQQQVPIVPISLLTNYKILPDVNPIRMHRFPMQAVVHEAIPTVGLTPQDVVSLRDKCYGVIDDELKKHHLPQQKGSKE